MSSKVLDPGSSAAMRRWEPKGIVASVAQPEPQDAVAPVAQIVPEVSADPVISTVVLSEPVAQPEVVVAEIDPEVLDQARAEGYALGLADGRRQVEQHASIEREALKVLLAGIGNLRKDLEGNVAGEALSLGMEIAKQVIRKALTLNPETILPVLRDAVLAIPGLSAHTVLHLHPLDAELVRPLLAEDPVLAQTTWRIVEDARMERGGARLETTHSEVDATLPTRWARVVAALGRDDAWVTPKSG